MASIGADLRLDQEAKRLQWMREHGIPVPDSCEYGRIGSIEYVVADEVPGLAASDAHWGSLLSAVVAALGQTLACLHRTRTDDCPFDQRIARQIEDARRRLAANRVDEADFDEIHAGRKATDLFTDLLSLVPDSEDLVFVHGRFLPSEHHPP